VYPSGLVDRAVAACSRTEQRRRLLLARLVMYFVLGLALFSPAPYLDVMRHLVEGLRGQGLLGDWHIPAKSSLIRARQRLGPEPLRVLFTTTAKPMGTEATPGAFWRGLRLLAVDGTIWDVADSPANEAAFGRPDNARGHDKSSLPQVRMACLIEVGTHLVLDAELAGCRTGEVTLVGRLPRSCDAGQLVLADRRMCVRCQGEHATLPGAPAARLPRERGVSSCPAGWAAQPNESRCHRRQDRRADGHIRQSRRSSPCVPFRPH
jgi:hypothetical protein